MKKFYDAKRELGELSNFYVHSEPLLFSGVTFATSEHLYHFHKYYYDGACAASSEYANVIRTASTPFKAKILANQMMLRRFEWQKTLCETITDYKNRGVSPRDDWESVKLEVMQKCVTIKFTQDGHCKKVLLSTHAFDLAEASSRDSFWGIGSDEKGQNHLGKILCQVRRELIIDQEKQTPIEYLTNIESDLTEDDPDLTEDDPDLTTDLNIDGCLLKKRTTLINGSAPVVKKLKPE